MLSDKKLGSVVQDSAEKVGVKYPLAIFFSSIVNFNGSRLHMMHTNSPCLMLKLKTEKNIWKTPLIKKKMQTCNLLKKKSNAINISVHEIL